MVLSLIAALALGTTNSPPAAKIVGDVHDPDIERAVALWREFDMPVSAGAAKWDAESFTSAEAPWSGDRGFGEDTLVSALVQSAAIGRWDFATALRKRLRQRKAGALELDSEWVGVPVDQSVSAATALVIATRFANELIQPAGDWRLIRDKVVRLNKHKLVKASRGWQNRGLDDLIAELNASLRSSGSGPVRAAVDDLVNCRAPQNGRWEFKGDVRYEHVKAFGLEAVPPLVDAMESKRLTRAFSQRFMNSPPMLVPVGSIAGDLLIDIAAGDLGKRDGQLTRKEVMGWYEAKRAGKVERYLLESVVETRKMEGETFPIVNGRTFEAIAMNYPNLFEEAMRLVLAHKPPVDPLTALGSIDAAKLPTEKKLAIVMTVARLPDIDRRTNAMWFLHHLDRQAYDRILIETLSAVPKSYDKAYAYYAVFATGTNNPRVWTVLDRALHKAGPAMRMEMLAGLLGGYEGLKPDDFKGRSVALLRRFFDDRGRPVIPEGDPRFKYWQWGGGAGGMPTVGQIALDTAAAVLGVGGQSGSAHTPKQWADLRKKVEARLHRRS